MRPLFESQIGSGSTKLSILLTAGVLLALFSGLLSGCKSGSLKDVTVVKPLNFRIKGNGQSLILAPPYIKLEGRFIAPWAALEDTLNTIVTEMSGTFINQNKAIEKVLYTEWDYAMQIDGFLKAFKSLGDSLSTGKEINHIDAMYLCRRLGKGNVMMIVVTDGRNVAYHQRTGIPRTTYEWEDDQIIQKLVYNEKFKRSKIEILLSSYDYENGETTGLIVAPIEDVYSKNTDLSASELENVEKIGITAGCSAVLRVALSTAFGEYSE